MINGYTLSITEIFKASFKSNPIDMYTGIDARDCGFKLYTGKEYVIYGIGGIYNDPTFASTNSSIWSINYLRTKLTDFLEINKLRFISK